MPNNNSKKPKTKKKVSQNTPPANRDVNGRFIPGKSGNPTGRPKGVREKVEAELKKAKAISPIRYLVKLMMFDINKRGAIKKGNKQSLTAALKLTEYLLGKPQVPMDIHHTGSPIDDILTKIYEENDLKRDE